MTIYESSYGHLYIMILCHGVDDFEAIVYKQNESQALATKQFKSIHDAFIWFNKDLLKTDISCSSCMKKINRQIHRAEEKYKAIIKEQ